MKASKRSIGWEAGGSLWESILCRPARPRGADTSAKTNDSSWWNIIIHCSYTALPKHYHSASEKWPRSHGSPDGIIATPISDLPPIHAWPLILRTNFFLKTLLESDQIEFTFCFMDFWKLTFGLPALQCRHHLPNLQYLQPTLLWKQQRNQFVGNYVLVRGVDDA